VVDSFELTDKYSIVVAEIPGKYDGKTIREVGFSPNHHVIVLTIMKNTSEKNLLGVFRKVSKLDIQGVASAETVLRKGDLMVLYGHKNDIQKILEDKN
jgi:trk system potassium uptake protein TrkA